MIEPYDDHNELKKQELNVRWDSLREQIYGKRGKQEFDSENKYMEARDK